MYCFLKRCMIVCTQWLVFLSWWFLYNTLILHVPISGPMLATKAKNFSPFLLGRPNFEPGGNLIQRFKEQHGIVYKNVAEEAASLDSQAKQHWLQTTLACTDEAERCLEVWWDCPFFIYMLPSKTRAFKSDPCPGGKHSKVRVTVLLCVNIDRSHQLKPFVIGQSKKPVCFKKEHVPVHYRSNKKAWITRDLFGEWMLELDGVTESQGWKVVLLLNNSAHTAWTRSWHQLNWFSCRWKRQQPCNR